MKTKSTFTRAVSVWGSPFFALLVALGSQMLLDAMVPASFAECLSVSLGYGTIYQAGGGSFWPSEVILLFVSFVLGGFVAARVAGVISRPFIVSLFFISASASFFQQFPSRPSVLWLVLWLLAGPVGAIAGVWAANATRTAA